MTHADRLSPDLTELGEFFEYCRAVDDLRNFTVLNYIGVLKILKKFDKKTGTASARSPHAAAVPAHAHVHERPSISTRTDGQLKAKWAPLLMKEPFYTSTALAALFTEVQCMCAQLIWHVKKVAPAPQDFSCPIWSVLTSLPEHVRACQGESGRVRACQGMSGRVRACQGVSVRVRACQGRLGDG